MDQLRLSIQLKCNELKLPLGYKHILQATIYNMLEKDTLGKFYHDQGFDLNDKKYKMFVFSDLFGEYSIENQRIVFKVNIKFYIDAMDQEFIKNIYSFLMNNKYIFIAKQQVEIVNIGITESPIFRKNKSVTIQTLSPVVAYTSKDKYFTYYSPSDEMFTKLVKQNIANKCKAYGYPIYPILFEIEEVLYQRKRIVKFKNNTLEGYQCQLKVKIDYDSFKMIYETGLSAKGSCGFGMIFKKDEKNNISL